MYTMNGKIGIALATVVASFFLGGCASYDPGPKWNGVTMRTQSRTIYVNGVPERITCSGRNCSVLLND